MWSRRPLLDLLAEIDRNLEDPVSLATLAARVGCSRYQLQRAFCRELGETPKQYTLRLRLERAAAGLISEERGVLAVALASGFASHEVFCRAFRRQYGCTPTRYRALVRARLSRVERHRHRTLTRGIGPCVRLFHLIDSSRRGIRMPLVNIDRKEIAEQPILFIRRRIAPSELQSTLAECFGTLFSHGQKAGLPIAGQPVTRYLSTGPGLSVIECAMPLARAVSGEGEMTGGVLPGGPVALGVHAGPYDELPETTALVERWIEEQGYRTNGPPWQSYVTDPAQHPDPADWRTEIYWPLAE